MIGYAVPPIREDPLILADTIVASDGTSLPSHTPGFNLAGNSWTDRNGNFTIQNNVANIQNASEAIYIATIDVEESDVLISADVHIQNNQAGIKARWASNNDYWRLSVNAGSNLLIIFERVGGSNQTRATASFECSNGETHPATFKLDGTNLVATVGSVDPVSTSYDSSNNQTNTNHGVFSAGNGGGLASFEVEKL